MLIGTTVYIVYSSITIVILLVMAHLFFKKRSATGALSMSIVMLLAAEWALCIFISALSSNMQLKIIFSEAAFLGIAAIPVMWFIFAMQYTRREEFLKARHYYLFSIIPCLTLFAVSTSSFHKLFITGVSIEKLYNSSVTLIGFNFGIGFWVHSVYSFLLIIAGNIILFERLIKSPKIYRKQALILIAAVLIPLGGELLFLLGLGPSKNLDTTTFSFTFTGVLFFIGMFRYKILDLVPIAREVIVETMTDLVIVLDIQERIIDINSSARNLLEKRHTKLMGEQINTIVSREVISVQEVGERQKYHKKVSLEIENQRIHFDVKKSFLYDKKNNKIGSVYVLHDITALEETLENLKKSKAAAESASRAKSEFLATMSHEIRTPITGIIGMAELLEDANLTRQERDNLSALEYSADTLLNLINDILDFSKIEAGKMKLESIRFNLRDLMNNTYKTFAYKKSYNVDFSLHIADTVPEFISGDSVRVKQIIDNLLSNAFKFTENGEIRIEVENVEGNGSEVLLQFRVADTGIGIAKDKISSLFQTFHQLDRSTTRKFGGTGLGLSIVKNLIDLMKGTIKAESEEDVGSTFTFQIPFKIAKNESSIESTSTKNVEGNNKKLKILVAEDSGVNQKLMTQILKRKGWEADIAENGEKAVHKYETDVYDLILMDIQMPEMDGYETAKIIREREKGTSRHIPIIALTANATEEDRNMCLQCGMDDFLTKPIKSEKLFSCIERWV